MTADNRVGVAQPEEEEILAKAGYRPELRRTLRFFSMFAIAFSIISITTGIFLNYAFGLSYWGPASIWTWPIVGVGNLMIALVVAELGTRIPLAGYAYQWSARLVNSTYGWFVGFAGLLYMSVGGGAIMLGVASPLLLSEFNVNTPGPRLVRFVALVLMILPVIINIISIQVAARVNNVAVFTEILGTVVFGVLLFVLWAVKSKPSPYGASILTNTTSTLHNPTIYAFALAGLLGAFTLVGFELAADMSEDAVDPRRSVPRGVIWAVAGSAVLGMIALIGFTIAIPNLKTVESAPLPLLAIAGYWLPGWLVKVFVAFVIFSMFSILVVGAGAQARLAYSMARDNMLPFSGLLKKVNPRTADAHRRAAGLRGRGYRGHLVRLPAGQRVRDAGRGYRDHPVHHLLPDHGGVRVQATAAGLAAGPVLARPVGLAGDHLRAGLQRADHLRALGARAVPFR